MCGRRRSPASSSGGSLEWPQYQLPSGLAAKPNPGNICASVGFSYILSLSCSNSSPFAPTLSPGTELAWFRSLLTLPCVAALNNCRRRHHLASRKRVQQQPEDNRISITPAREENDDRAGALSYGPRSLGRRGAVSPPQRHLPILRLTKSHTDSRAAPQQPLLFGRTPQRSPCGRTRR